MDKHKMIQIVGPDTRHIQITLGGEEIPYVLGVDLEGKSGVIFAQVEMIATVDVLATYMLAPIYQAILTTRRIRRQLDPTVDPLPTVEAIQAKAATFPPIGADHQPIPLLHVEASEAAALLRLSWPDTGEVLKWTWARKLHLAPAGRYPFLDLVLVTPPALKAMRGRKASKLAQVESIEHELWGLLGDRSV